MCGLSFSASLSTRFPSRLSGSRFASIRVALSVFFSSSPVMYSDIFLSLRIRRTMGWNTCWKKGSCNLLFSM